MNIWIWAGLAWGGIGAATCLLALPDSRELTVAHLACVPLVIAFGPVFTVSWLCNRYADRVIFTRKQK